MSCRVIGLEDGRAALYDSTTERLLPPIFGRCGDLDAETTADEFLFFLALKGLDARAVEDLDALIEEWRGWRPDAAALRLLGKILDIEDEDDAAPLCSRFVQASTIKADVERLHKLEMAGLVEISGSSLDPDATVELTVNGRRYAKEFA